MKTKWITPGSYEFTRDNGDKYLITNSRIFYSAGFGQVITDTINRVEAETKNAGILDVDFGDKSFYCTYLKGRRITLITFASSRMNAEMFLTRYSGIQQ